MKKKIKLLLIEDNEEDCYAFLRNLRKLNESSNTVEVIFDNRNSLADSIEVLTEKSIDIIVLDLSLPDSNGFEGLQLLIDKFENTIPIIVLTGDESELTALNAIKEGAQDYLQKNEINPSSLVRSIMYAIERNNSAKEIEKLRVQQAKSLKMATLGEMAGSIAHEINNPLTIMLGYADRISRAKEENIEECREAARKITTVVLRCAKIVKSLKGYTRKDEDDPKETSSLKNIVDDTMNLCFEKIKLSGIDLQIGDIVNVNIFCNDVQLSQVLLNMINNSCDAIKNNAEKWIKVYSELEGEKVHIFISDSGVITDSDTKRKIFQPFFTTKGKGLGTGLGMSISKNIVDSHQGTLSLLDSKNTTFKITLPVKN